MTNKTKTATEDRIRELVPRLKELSFGCYFKRISDGEICNMTVFGDKFILDYVHPNLRSPAPLLISEVEIIGHQITLEDVLEAISITLKGKESNCMNFWVNEYKKLSHSLDIGVWDWQLGKPLDRQSKETQDFISDLLK